MNSAILKSGLDALHYSGAARALAPVTRGVGIIFMLHHVKPCAGKAFDPNGILSITPEFLGAAIKRTRELGWDIVSVGEVVDRLSSGTASRPFAAFTLDDGYRDNLECALPVFKMHGAPFAVYVSSAAPQGSAELWWIGLEEVIARNDEITIERDGVEKRIPCATLTKKNAAWQELYPWIRRAPEDEQRAIVRDLCARHGVSMEKLCRDVSMSWDEVRTLASDPLVTIGNHTVNHFALNKLDEARARQEMSAGADAIAAEIGIRPEHFAYPYGDPGSAGAREFDLAKSLGFRSAVTTRKGMLTGKHRDRMFALPRVALNGDFQAVRYVDTFLSGAPFFLLSRFQPTLDY
ncbi:MAG: polysaccharide deacetylase family protein [Hyphomonadaceae bacterium]|nr:polysaccharide deacetylase family protein [Hyphomonadaceae bacterium]